MRAILIVLLAVAGIGITAGLMVLGNYSLMNELGSWTNTGFWVGTTALWIAMIFVVLFAIQLYFWCVQ